jgi:uncharacterized protein YdhG (YjbR/CyaY superfamily)
MSVIDDYLKKIEPPARNELNRIRRLAKQVVPRAEEAISYGMPTLKYRGKPFLGFDAHAHHIGLYPYSGSVLPKLKAELREFTQSKGALRVPYDKPISKSLLGKIISQRLKAIKAKPRPAR